MGRTKSISQKAKTSAGRTVGLIFLSVLAIAGLAVSYFWSLNRYVEYRNSKSWVETPCHIISSSVGTHSGDDSTTYSVDIHYEYEYEGEKYESKRYSFIGGSSSGYKSKEKIVQRYPAGSASTCYVNPSDPATALLNRDFTPSLLLLLIGPVVALIGILGLWGVLRAGRKQTETVYDRPGVSSAIMDDAIRAGDQGPIELRPETSTATKLIVPLILCGAGIGGGVLFSRVGFPKFVVYPFFGIFTTASLAAFVYFLLGSFNPVPVMVVSSRAVPLGGAFELKWSFEGNINSIRSLTIELEGREEATYQRGTNSTTDKSVFARIPIAESTRHGEMIRGSMAVVIPPGAMHTFKADNNKVLWMLKLRGDIPHWPDVKQEYEMTILPARTEEV